MQNYILIGGAPLTGKSTIAKNFTNHIQISTDEIRSLMHNLLKPEDNTNLFYGFGLNAVDFYNTYKTAEEVFEKETKQAEATQEGVSALIKSEFSWENICIEGIAITPKFVCELSKNKAINVRGIFLYDYNKDRIRERLFKRGLYDDAEKYPDHLKEIELEWVIFYNQFYKHQAEKYKMELYSIDEIAKIKY